MGSARDWLDMRVCTTGRNLPLTLQRLWRLVVGEIGLHFDAPCLYSCRIRRFSRVGYLGATTSLYRRKSTLVGSLYSFRTAPPRSI